MMYLSMRLVCEQGVPQAQGYPLRSGVPPFVLRSTSIIDSGVNQNDAIQSFTLFLKPLPPKDSP